MTNASLSNYYVLDRIEVAVEATSGASSTPNVTARTSSHSSSVSAIVGGVVGGVFGIAALAITAYSILRRRSRGTRWL